MFESKEISKKEFNNECKRLNISNKAPHFYRLIEFLNNNRPVICGGFLESDIKNASKDFKKALKNYDKCLLKLSKANNFDEINNAVRIVTRIAHKESIKFYNHVEMAYCVVDYYHNKESYLDRMKDKSQNDMEM